MGVTKKKCAQFTRRRNGHTNKLRRENVQMSLNFPPFLACDRAKCYNCPPDYITVYTQPDYYIIKIKCVIPNAIKACIYRLNSF